MNFELEGKIIEKGEIVNISDTFKKREFVIENVETISTGSVINNFIKFQLTQNRVDLINDFEVNNKVKVNFNIRGNKWEKDGKVSYFTNLEAWRVQAASDAQPAVNSSSSINSSQPAPDFEMPAPSDDLPF